MTLNSFTREIRTDYYIGVDMLPILYLYRCIQLFTNMLEVFKWEGRVVNCDELNWIIFRREKWRKRGHGGTPNLTSKPLMCRNIVIWTHTPPYSRPYCRKNYEIGSGPSKPEVPVTSVYDIVRWTHTSKIRRYSVEWSSKLFSPAKVSGLSTWKIRPIRVFAIQLL